MRKKLVIALCVFLGNTTLLYAAMNPEEKGLNVMTEVDMRDSGWENSQTRVKMILDNGKGKQVTREMVTYSLEVENDGDKSLTLFNNPRDLKGTAFLSYTHKTGADDQWLYLPALKRVKRISSSNRSGPFMGSELAYEDITSQEIERYTYKYLRDEPCGEQAMCFVVERYPVDKNSGYTKQIVWIHKTHYRLEKIEYYDRKGALVKVQTMSDYAHHFNQFWRANTWEIRNVQTGKSTTLLWEDYTFRVGLTEDDFKQGSLKRAR